jgi:glycosyltransferase involved in cell wall biosynthesis
MPVATVVLPTHDHATTLPYALESVQRQTVEDLEIVVVGDGVGDDTREVVAARMREDARIRFLDRPKGERHGERHRHEALAGARGRIVCYA